MDNNKLTLAEQFKKLEEITKAFESGDLDLEQAIPKFEEGTKLAKELKKKLQEMENRIETLSINASKQDES